MNDDQQQLAIDFHAPATTPPADAFALRKARYEEARALYEWALEQAIAAVDLDGFVAAIFDEYMRALESFKARAWREFLNEPTYHFTIRPSTTTRDSQGRCQFFIDWTDDGRPRGQVQFCNPEETAERLRRSGHTVEIVG